MLLVTLDSIDYNHPICVSTSTEDDDWGGYFFENNLKPNIMKGFDVFITLLFMSLAIIVTMIVVAPMGIFGRFVFWIVVFCLMGLLAEIADISHKQIMHEQGFSL